MLKIVSSPNLVLSEKAKPISIKQGKIDKEILYLIEEMKETLDNPHDPEGVGLAAPQVGKSLQLFLLKPTPNSKVEVFINPEVEFIKPPKEKVTKRKKRKQNSTKLEGCLSLPQIWGVVKRENKLKVTYFDENGEKKTNVFSGFKATIIQHEYDHLQGILFPKRVLEQNEELYKSHKNEKGEDIFEKLEI